MNTYEPTIEGNYTVTTTWVENPENPRKDKDQNEDILGTIFSKCDFNEVTCVEYTDAKAARKRLTEKLDARVAYRVYQWEDESGVHLELDEEHEDLKYPDEKPTEYNDRELVGYIYATEDDIKRFYDERGFYPELLYGIHCTFENEIMELSAYIGNRTYETRITDNRTGKEVERYLDFIEEDPNISDNDLQGRLDRLQEEAEEEYEEAEYDG